MLCSELALVIPGAVNLAGPATQTDPAPLQGDRPIWCVLAITGAAGPVIPASMTHPLTELLSWMSAC